MKRILAQVLPLCAVAVFATGCTHFDPVTNSTLNGAGLGSAAGAIIGHQSDNAGAGAVLGAAVGAIGGALAGEAHHARAERDAAYAYADRVNRSQPYQASVTNADVVYMTHNGLGDAVIINAINSRGGQFDTSPNALISLKQNGVSDSVIGVMQNATPRVAPVVYTAPEPSPPPVIVVEPRRRPIIIGHPHRCAPRRRTGVFIHGSF